MPPALALPATLAILSASWFLGVLERFWLRCLPAVERTLRKCTSVALKKATMKGCLFWGPWRPIRPASLGLTLCPGREAAEVGKVGAGRGGSGCTAPGAPTHRPTNPRSKHSAWAGNPFRHLEHSWHQKGENAQAQASLSVGKAGSRHTL